MKGPVLEAIGVTKRYGNLLVSDNISLQLYSGARHALIGPNGAGKSTFIHQLSGVVRPDQGKVILEGRDVTSLAAHRRVVLGLGRTFQVTNLFPELTVLHNILLALNERSGLSQRFWWPAAAGKALIAEAGDIAQSLNLSRCLAKLTREIAYGEQRLLEIAVALALKPKVLLLDEPAAGIPKGEVRVILNAMAHLPVETAILLIEHDMLIVREFAQIVSVLVDGRLIASGVPADVLASSTVRDVYLGRGKGAVVSALRVEKDV